MCAVVDVQGRAIRDGDCSLPTGFLGPICVESRDGVGLKRFLLEPQRETTLIVHGAPRCRWADE